MTTLRFNSNTADERGITHWGKNDVRRRYLVQDFARDRGRGRGNERIGGIIEKIMAVFARKFCGAFTGSGLTQCASLYDLRAEGDNSRALYRVRIFRKKNCGADLRNTRGVGNCGTVVTGTRRDNSWQHALRRTCEQSVKRSAQFERAGWQIALDFQINSCA